MNMSKWWRLFVLILLPAGLALSLPARAVSPAWDMTGTYTICFDYAVPQPLCAGGFLHDMTITSMDMVSGEFAGNGSYPAGGAPMYTWPIEGKVTGSLIYFELAYNELTDHWLTGTGSIDPSGLPSGTATDSLGQSLFWAVTPATHFKPWDGALRSMGYYKQTRNRVFGYVTAYISSCDIKNVESTGGLGPAPPAQTFDVFAGQTYKITSLGTYFANDGIFADAKYSSRNNGPWQDAVQNYEYLGPELLDLRVDWISGKANSGSSPDWGMYNPMHSYTVPYTAPGPLLVLSMGINDINTNNTGALQVTVCGPTDEVTVNADAVWSAFGAYSSSPWTKFLAQYGVTVFNLKADPALGLAVFWKPGNAFSGMTVSQLVVLGDTYTTSTPKTDLLALKDVFDWINNNMYLYY